MGSSLYEAWVRSLRVSWMGQIAQRIFGGFAAVIGDKTVDWALQGVLEHFPNTASPPSVALLGSERQLDSYSDEPSADLAEREPYWLVINKFRSRALGLLLGLHFSGFDGAVVIQQNGRAFQLSLPLPPFVDDWDPKPNLVITQTAATDVRLTSSVTPTHGVAAGTPWWTIDSDTDFCSRFVVLFPGPVLPSSFLTWGIATFTGIEDGSPSRPWPTVVWNNPFSSTAYCVSPGAITTTGGGVSVYAVGSSKTLTSVQIGASDPFVGTVDVLAYQSGANPFADLHPGDLARLRALVKKWKPGKSTCMGVYALTQGKFSAWPVGTMAQMLGVPSTIAAFVQGV